MRLKLSARREGSSRSREGLRVKQEDVTREITGPPKSVAFDAAGEPTRAALSFAEKQGVPLSKLSIVSTPKGEYLAVKQTVYGRPAAEILAKASARSDPRNRLAALHVLDRRREPALHPPDPLDRRAAR